MGILSLIETESRVCDIAAEQLGIKRATIHPGLRVIQDLHCDSLDLVELFMTIEGAFDVTLPQDPTDPAYKAVFTRDPFRLRDLAEMVYLRQRVDESARVEWRCGTVAVASAPAPQAAPFTQLDGWFDAADHRVPLFEPLPGTCEAYRRRTDGMVCLALPGGDVVLGTPDDNAPEDERPVHRATLAPFLIDREPVSTTAYCRFLNSVAIVDPLPLEAWFALPPSDRRRQHELLRFEDDRGWTPLPGTERMPMILVSWYGANAYSLWANGLDWRRYDGGDDTDSSFLPSEAQWEYAARGPAPRRFPWGDEDATGNRLQYSLHARGNDYAPHSLPLARVNERLGLSPFGLHHMAGNVWQWCRDWYAPGFYRTPEASTVNPLNRCASRVRSERGGSWIGPAALCRSSYRRGRVPSAKGRCLGFRCVGRVEDVSASTPIEAPSYESA